MKRMAEQEQAAAELQEKLWVAAELQEVKVGGVAKFPTLWVAEPPQLQMASSAQPPREAQPPTWRAPPKL